MNSNALTLPREIPVTLLARGMKPIAELVEDRPHGDRIRYLSGCRCALCRQANTAYERERRLARKAGDWNGIVDATKAREHLLALSACGVGRRAVSAATDISEAVLLAIRTGKKLKLRARTERRILSVTADMASDHALVDASSTWQLVRELKQAGITLTRIAIEMGNKGRGLQLSKDRITVKKAAKMVIVHAKLMQTDEVLVAAGPSLRLLRQMREEGFTEKQLARHLDLPNGEYAISRTRITVGLKRRIDALYQSLMF